VEICAVL